MFGSVVSVDVGGRVFCSLIARCLLMVAVLFRICCRWVIVLSPCCRYRSRLRAVFESCTSM